MLLKIKMTAKKSIKTEIAILFTRFTSFKLKCCWTFRLITGLLWNNFTLITIKHSFLIHIICSLILHVQTEEKRGDDSSQLLAEPPTNLWFTSMRFSDGIAQDYCVYFMPVKCSIFFVQGGPMHFLDRSIFTGCFCCLSLPHQLPLCMFVM